MKRYLIQTGSEFSSCKEEFLPPHPLKDDLSRTKVMSFFVYKNGRRKIDKLICIIMPIEGSVLNQ